MRYCNSFFLFLVRQYYQTVFLWEKTEIIAADSPQLQLFISLIGSLVKDWFLIPCLLGFLDSSISWDTGIHIPILYSLAAVFPVSLYNYSGCRKEEIIYPIIHCFALPQILYSICFVFCRFPLFVSWFLVFRVLWIICFLFVLYLCLSFFNSRIWSWLFCWCVRGCCTSPCWG